MANKEPKKSKYFRDSDDKPSSKYIRKEGEERKRKYFKTDADREADMNKRQNNSQLRSSYHKNAGASNLENRISAQKDKKEQAKGKLPQEVTSLEEINAERKGDHAAIFTKEKADKRAKKYYREAENAPDDNRRATQIVRTGLIILALLVVAIIFNLFQVGQNDIHYLPSFISVEFSAIPEFIAALAYGPIVGVIIALVKNVLHMIMNQPSFISEVQNFVLDSFYIFVGGFLYTRRMFNFKPNKYIQKKGKHGRDLRAKRIFNSGCIGTVATTIVTFFITRYFSYPLLFRMFANNGYTDEALLAAYQESLDMINADLPEALRLFTSVDNSVSKSILLFNVPLTFIKFFFITIIVALLYPPISDFLHYRVRSKHSHHSSSRHSGSHHSSTHRSGSHHSSGNHSSSHHSSHHSSSQTK